MEAKFRLSYGSVTTIAYICTRHRPDRMRGNAEEASVISARVRKTRIEIPVVRRKHMEVSPYQGAAPAFESKQGWAGAVAKLGHVWEG